MHADQLDDELIRGTLNVLLKYQDDIEAINPEIRNLLASQVAS